MCPFFKYRPAQRDSLSVPFIVSYVAHSSLLRLPFQSSAGRMKAKGCISEVLDWPTSREFFYWRIRRRQAEDPLKDRLVQASNGALDLDLAAARVSLSVSMCVPMCV